MTRAERSLEPGYFEALYASDPDPWRFETSPYEQEKYAATMEALPCRHYAAALEVGCSIGVLTRQLAARCASLIAIDVAARALTQATMRCADLPHVQLARMQVPDEWPDGRFDLVVLSEVVYYLDPGDVRRLAERVRASLLPSADILLVHWTGPTNYPLGGDEAVDLLVAALGRDITPKLARRSTQYRLDLLSTHRPPT